MVAYLLLWLTVALLLCTWITSGREQANMRNSTWLYGLALIWPLMVVYFFLGALFVVLLPARWQT